MTTLSPPLSSAVRVTLPPTPLPFCSTSFAFTVVTADALTGTRSMAAAAAKTSELRNLPMYPLASDWEHPVLGDDVISSYSTPQIGSRFLPRHFSQLYQCRQPIYHADSRSNVDG